MIEVDEKDLKALTDAGVAGEEYRAARARIRALLGPARCSARINADEKTQCVFLEGHHYFGSVGPGEVACCDHAASHPIHDARDHRVRKDAWTR